MKIAWFYGNVKVPENTHEYLSQEQIVALPVDDWRRPWLSVLLVPDDFDLTEMTGDDWNDAPADCNAGRPYVDRIKGAVWLDLYVGDRWPTGYAARFTYDKEAE